MINEREFYWISETLSDLKDDRNFLILENCLEPRIGELINYLGLDLIECFLKLSDDDLIDLHPESKCLFSFEERQHLKQRISKHVKSCNSCAEIERINNFDDAIIDEITRQHMGFIRDMTANEPILTEIRSHSAKELNRKRV